MTNDAPAPTGRTASYGQLAQLSVVDRLGTWLSLRKIRSLLNTKHPPYLGDFGAGYDARAACHLATAVAHTTVVDLALADDLKRDPRFTAIEGHLPEAMALVPDASLDVALCVSVLEHLNDPVEMLHQLRRVLAPGAVLFINVPSWRGKTFLEFSAFRLHLSPAIEMDDHKTYYDPRDLWPLLVEAGFVPHDITCRRHKFGLNTYAICRVDNA